MNKIDKVFKSLLRWCRVHKPDILTGLGLGGMGAAVYYTSKVAPKTKEEMAETIDGREKVLIAIRNYFPVAVMYGTSSAAILYSNKIRIRQFGELASAYAAARSEIGDISSTIATEIGVEAAKNVKEKLAEKRVNETDEAPTVIPNEQGEILFYDDFSGRYFYNTIENMQRIQNDLNAALLRDEEVFLNDYFYKIKLRRLGYGDFLGWHLIKGVYELIEFDMTNTMRSDDGKPCIIVDIVTQPRQLVEL